MKKIINQILKVMTILVIATNLISCFLLPKEAQATYSAKSATIVVKTL